MSKRTVGKTPGLHYMDLNAHSFTFGYMEIGFTLDEDVLLKEMIRIGAPAEARVLPDSCAAVATMVHDRKGIHYRIVALKPSFHKPITHDIGIIVHECVHVRQHLSEILAESEPGAEWEAYVVEAITVFCVGHYLRARQRHDEVVTKQKTSDKK